MRAASASHRPRASRACELARKQPPTVSRRSRTAPEPPRNRRRANEVSSGAMPNRARLIPARAVTARPEGCVSGGWEACFSAGVITDQLLLLKCLGDGQASRLALRLPGRGLLFCQYAPVK